MSKVFGPITLSAGTGLKPINLGVSGITRVQVEATLPNVAYVSKASGAWDSGYQRYRSEVESWGSPAVGALFELVNQAGVVVYRASCTGIVGTIMNWDVLVNSIVGAQPTLMLYGDDQV